VAGGTEAQAPEVELEVPPEPGPRREELRRELLGGADWEGRFGADLGVGGVLWEAWGPQLEARGMDGDAFSAVVRGCRRELWLWVLGDRSWRQAAGAVAGRAVRRLPGG
jgi:hypothetical protein